VPELFIVIDDLIRLRIFFNLGIVIKDCYNERKCYWKKWAYV